MGIDEHHGDECHVIRRGNRDQNQELGNQPITAFDGGREDAFDEPIRARACEENGRERDKRERHEEVGDDAIPVEPGVLGAHRGDAADSE